MELMKFITKLEEIAFNESESVEEETLMLEELLIDAKEQEWLIFKVQ